MKIQLSAFLRKLANTWAASRFRHLPRHSVKQRSFVLCTGGIPKLPCDSINSSSHRRPNGSVDVRSRRCAAAACLRRAAYGGIGEGRQRCATHRLGGDVDKVHHSTLERRRRREKKPETERPGAGLMPGSRAGARVGENGGRVGGVLRDGGQSCGAPASPWRLGSRLPSPLLTDSSGGG